MRSGISAAKAKGTMTAISKIFEERAKLIEHMLSSVESHLDDLKRSSEFIESLRDQFTTHGRLSDNQIEALRKFYAHV
jgi:hypothetical protein